MAKVTSLEPELDRAIGERIRMRRRLLGMSQTELGKRLSVSFQQVQKYEQGKNRISSSTLARAARALDTSVDAFLNAGDIYIAKAAGESDDADWQKLVRAFGAIRSAEERRIILKLVTVLSNNPS